MGMMGAFAKLATMDGVEASVLAQDIQFALITTACGLAIAIPLVLCVASINVRIRKMEDLGILEGFKAKVSYTLAGYQLKAIITLRAFMGKLKPFLEMASEHFKVAATSRVSIGCYNTLQDIEALVAAIQKLKKIFKL